MEIKRPSSHQEMPSGAKKVFSGVLFDVYQWKQEMFDGTTSIFEKVKRLDTVQVIPITSDRKIILTEQEQPGMDAPFLSLPGGRIDPGEHPLDAARRELKEESGYESNTFKLWRSEQPGGKVDWAVYTFVAHEVQLVSSPELDSGEKIQLREVTFDEFLRVVSFEDFRDKEIIAPILRAQLLPNGIQELKHDILGL